MKLSTLENLQLTFTYLLLQWESVFSAYLIRWLLNGINSVFLTFDSGDTVFCKKKSAQNAKMLDRVCFRVGTYKSKKTQAIIYLHHLMRNALVSLAHNLSRPCIIQVKISSKKKKIKISLLALHYHCTFHCTMHNLLFFIYVIFIHPSDSYARRASVRLDCRVYTDVACPERSSVCAVLTVEKTEFIKPVAFSIKYILHQIKYRFQILKNTCCSIVISIFFLTTYKVHLTLNVYSKVVRSGQQGAL